MCTAKKKEARLLCRHGSTKLSKYFVRIISEDDDIEIKTKLKYEKSYQICKNFQALRATERCSQCDDIHGFSKSWNLKFQEKGQGNKPKKLGRGVDLMATFNETKLN